jgi:hypothetical protein
MLGKCSITEPHPQPQPALELFSFGFIFVFEKKSHFIAQAGLELEFLLPQPAECWDYRRVPLHLAFQIFFYF